jgi:tRNA(Ile)-lysidine synthase
VQPHPLVTAVRLFLQSLPAAPDLIVIGVSGGPDSVALLLALHELKRTLLAAHLNHRLRGAESDGDESFVAGLCQSHGIELAVERLDVRAIAAQHGENLEAAARQSRYAFFQKLAEERRATLVATGHTADDQAETLLHHLLRGTGLRGLRGVARRRPLNAEVTLIRPLIDVPRSMVVDYLESERLTPRLDSSNADLRLTRNRIRHELLPRLRAEYNPGLTEHLCKLAEQAQVLYGELEAEARVLLADVERPRAGSMIVLDAEALANTPRHLLREVLHLIWEREGWAVGGMDFNHWQRLAELVQADEGARDLPAGVHATRKGRVLQLSRVNT